MVRVKISATTREYLEKLREKTGKSWYEIAKEMGFSESYWREIMTRRANFTELQARRIADYFAIDWKPLIEP